MDITELLAFSAKQGASDLHLSAGLPPMIRVDGDVRRINLPPMEHKEVHALIYDIMNDKQRKILKSFWKQISRLKCRVLPDSVLMHLTKIVVQVRYFEPSPPRY